MKLDKAQLVITSKYPNNSKPLFVSTHFMKPFLLIGILLTLTAGHSQTATLPNWFSDTFKSKGLDKKYVIATFLKPSYLQADFNGDATLDIAVFVFDKATRKKGILLIHGKTYEQFVFGAGTAFGNGGKDFKWADKWKLYTKKTAFETQFDEESHDIIGAKEINLARPGILIENYENGAALAGGIIYWNGKKYVWIHQGE